MVKNGVHAINSQVVADTSGPSLLLRSSVLTEAFLHLAFMASASAPLNRWARTQVERETFINGLNQKIQRAASIPDVLQIATRELGQVLNARRATAQVNNPIKNAGSSASAS